MGEWISLDDEVPPNDVFVELRHGDRAWIAKLNGNWWVWKDIPDRSEGVWRIENEATHWRHYETKG